MLPPTPATAPAAPPAWHALSQLCPLQGRSCPVGEPALPSSARKMGTQRPVLLACSAPGTSARILGQEDQGSSSAAETPCVAPASRPVCSPSPESGFPAFCLLLGEGGGPSDLHSLSRLASCFGPASPSPSGPDAASPVALNTVQLTSHGWSLDCWLSSLFACF